jgi:hypothetical protein
MVSKPSFTRRKEANAHISSKFLHQVSPTTYTYTWSSFRPSGLSVSPFPKTKMIARITWVPHSEGGGTSPKREIMYISKNRGRIGWYPSSYRPNPQTKYALWIKTMRIVHRKPTLHKISSFIYLFLGICFSFLFCNLHGPLSQLFSSFTKSLLISIL